MTTCYKVELRRHRTGLLHSTLSVLLLSQWDVVYTPNEWAKAPFNSGLFVFTGLKRAQQFASYSQLKMEVWECECKDPVEAPKFVPSPSRFAQDNHETFQRFWEGQESRQDQLYMLPTPTATAFFKQVKLTKHIEEVLR